MQEDIKKDLTAALRAGEALRAETLRSLLAAIHNAEIEKRTRGGASELSDEEVLGVLQKEAKKRKEAAEIYGNAGRNELEQKEKRELEIIASYLPAQLSREEVEVIVRKAVEAHGGKGFGAVMRAVLEEVQGRAEAKEVSEIVKRVLGQ